MTTYTACPPECTATSPEHTHLTADELTESLDGWDELAISREFGADIGKLRKDKLRFLRALIFIDKRRGGDKDPIAYKAAMGVKTVDLDGYFADDPEEIDPDEPVTDAGKDDSPSE